MTMQNVFERLTTIAAASNGGARGGTILACDMIHQGALYRMQEELASLLADVANQCGPRYANRLQSLFPYAFESR